MSTLILSRDREYWARFCRSAVLLGFPPPPLRCVETPCGPERPDEPVVCDLTAAGMVPGAETEDCDAYLCAQGEERAGVPCIPKYSPVPVLLRALRSVGCRGDGGKKRCRTVCFYSPGRGSGVSSAAAGAAMAALSGAVYLNLGEAAAGTPFRAEPGPGLDDILFRLGSRFGGTDIFSMLGMDESGVRFPREPGNPADRSGLTPGAAQKLICALRDSGEAETIAVDCSLTTGEVLRAVLPLCDSAVCVIGPGDEKEQNEERRQCDSAVCVIGPGDCREGAPLRLYNRCPDCEGRLTVPDFGKRTAGDLCRLFAERFLRLGLCGGEVKF